MPNLNYDTIARILSKSEPQTWRITDNGGMVVISADGKRLSFTPAEVNEADLPRVYPNLPIIKPAPVPDVIIAPKPPVILSVDPDVPFVRDGEKNLQPVEQTAPKPPTTSHKPASKKSAPSKVKAKP